MRRWLFLGSFSLDSAEQLVAHQSVFWRTQPKSLLEQVCSGKVDARMKQKRASSQICPDWFVCVQLSQTELTGLKLAALESNKSLDLEKKEGRIDDLLRVSEEGSITPLSLCCVNVTEPNLFPTRPTVTCGDR